MNSEPEAKSPWIPQYTDQNSPLLKLPQALLQGASQLKADASGKRSMRTGSWTSISV